MTILKLEAYRQQNIDVTNLFTYAMLLCKNHAEYDLECAKILEKLINASEADQYSIIQRNGYINLAIESLNLFTDFKYEAKLAQLDFDFKKTLIKDYINDCKYDSNNSSKLEQTFKKLTEMKEIDLDFIATLLYTLENKLFEFKKNHRPIQDLNLLQQLIDIINPLVLSSPLLIKIYKMCKAHFTVSYSGDKTIEYAINEDLILHIYNACKKIETKLNKMNNKLETVIENLIKTEEDSIVAIEDQNNVASNSIEMANKALILKVNSYKALDQYPLQILLSAYMKNFHSVTPKINQTACDKDKIVLDFSMPGVFDLTLENYKCYYFSVFYQLTCCYNTALKFLMEIKDLVSEQLYQEIDQEIKEINQEAQELICNAKVITKMKRDQASKLYISNFSVTDIPEDFNSIKNWEKILLTINKDNLICLEQLFNFDQNNHLKLSRVKNMIKALGGKVYTYDGSKTKILLPNTSTCHLNHLQTVGGLHKPHTKDANLHWCHSKLITKALGRAGLTKQIFKKFLTTIDKSSNVTIKKKNKISL